MLSDNFSPNTLRPVFSNALSLKFEAIKLDAFIKNYSTGQTLTGKVHHVLPEQKAVVEIQGDKLLLQFPRTVNAGQHIAIKIEQTHPSIVLRLTDLPSSVVSQKIAPGNDVETVPLNKQESDKTTIRNKSGDASLRAPLPVARDRQSIPTEKEVGFFSRSELKQLGIEVGQKARVEILRVVNRETLQVRLNGNDVTVKHTVPETLQAGESVYIRARSNPSGKFSLEVEQINVPPVSTRFLSKSSVLKSYLPARQSLGQVFAGLKEVFLEGPSTQFKKLNIDLGQLKQLQNNLQKIVSQKLRTPDASQLKEIIDRSGFQYEAKVKSFVSEADVSSKNALLEKDLKGQLMRLARELEQIPRGAAENTSSDRFIGKLMSQVNQSVSNIELQQLVHHFSREEQLPLLLQLPENLLSEEDRFKIFVLPDQKEGAQSESDLQNRVFNLVFLLNLSFLGDLRIETKVLKDDISIHIIGSNPEAVQFIQVHVPELEDIFRKEGFSINVTSGHQSEVSMEIPDTLGQLLIDTPLQMVDLKT